MLPQLVESLFSESELNPAFRSAIERADSLSISPSLTIRKPICRIVIATPSLLERNFRRHSVGELASAQTLQAVASTVKQSDLRGDLLTHCEDEMRHSRMFAALADHVDVGPERSLNEDYEWILENDRRFVEKYNGNIAGFICDMFAGEVRTYSFISGYIESLAADGSPLSKKLNAVLTRILEDESRHIRYTGQYINGWMQEGLDLRPSILRSFEGFDRNSWVEVAATAEFFYKRPTRYNS